MRALLLLLALAFALPAGAWSVFPVPPGGGGGGGGTPDDGSVTVEKMAADDFGGLLCPGSGGACVSIVLAHATDCSTRTAVPRGAQCYDQDDGTEWLCNASDGTCDAGGDWLKVGGPGFVAQQGANAATFFPIGVLPTARGGTGNAALSFPSGTETVVGRASTDTLTFKTIAGGTGTTTRASGSNIITIRQHATDCTVITDGARGELCQDQDDGRIWGCTSSTCNASGWVSLAPLSAAARTWGGGATITETFDAGATDPKVVYGSGSIGWDADGDGSAECTVDADGLTCTQVETDNNEAGVGGNAMSVLANDTTNPDIGCGDAPSNSLSVTDADQSAADRFDVCVGTTRRGTLGWIPFSYSWAFNPLDPDGTFDGRCMYSVGNAEPNNTFPANTAPTCFASAQAHGHAYLKVTGKQALVTSFLCRLDTATGETTGDVLELELIEDTIAGASATVVGSITFTSGTDMGDGTLKAGSFTPVATVAAEAGLAVRVQWTDGSSTAVSALSAWCRVDGMVEP